jgi:predicted nucleic acid-binding Zn ribbon protein
MICSNKECAKEFDPKTHNQKYCSDECRDHATLEQKSYPALPPINCSVCGEQFRPTYISRTWCSRKCQKAMYRKKEKAERMNDPMPEVYVYRKSCIDDINGKARENGTTYGKYKALELIDRFAKVEIPEWAVRR